ncbi:MAG: universal stress protein [Bacteroidales bacterium]|nr:universal stress protein [Bacteroidales bacterium]MCF8403681.1 universal stress protein [Bacteroidales bacterium]
MKQILVAIDFSKCSVNALEYAIHFANQIRSNITLVWVDNTSTDENVFSNPYDVGRKEINNNFNELIEKYQPMLEHGEMTFKIRKGKVHVEIANQAKYSDAMLVLLGTHGVSGFEEFWIGSNAHRIVTYSPCPVITIRTSYSFENGINTIVLPIDSTLETRQKIPFTTKIAKYFDSEVHILSLYSTSIKAVRYRVDNYSKQVAKYFDEEDVKYTIASVEAENITNSTINYATSVRAELITIMTEQETTTANLFLGAYAQQMVNHSPIPVLSIHAKEYIRIQSR